jgi:hypothetical protein
VIETWPQKWANSRASGEREIGLDERFLVSRPETSKGGALPDVDLCLQTLSR